MSSSSSSSVGPEPRSLSPWAQLDIRATNGCWNFVQHDSKSTPPEFSKIPTTTNSLEMCTEILGCETGCHVYPQTMHERQPPKIWKKTKQEGGGCFPPPLTSIATRLRVQARRGGGRLLITAAAASGVCFKSERENGRLRLFLQEYCDEGEREFMAENGGRIGCAFKCGDGSGTKNLTSLPVCVAFS